MPSRIASVRVPDDLAVRIDAFAAQTGMTWNELITHALDLMLGGQGDPAIAFLTQVRAWVQATYRSDAFPEDVTLRVFQHIRSDDRLFATYQACLASAGPANAYQMKASIHRRIGLMVKRVLNATVIGRSLPLDPAVNLISSCALLRPTAVPHA